MHTGVNSLMNMFYNQGTGTVLILDNSTTGMTGHQDHAATGKTLRGEIVPAIDLYKLCHDGIGIENTRIVNAFDTKELEKALKEELAKDAVSVIIVQAHIPEQKQSGLNHLKVKTEKTEHLQQELQALV